MAKVELKIENGNRKPKTFSLNIPLGFLIKPG
jgi:hypothetical protein